MKTISFIIQKEFLQLRRNRLMFPVLFIVPLVQLIILANAATLEMKNLRMAIVDRDFSSTSRALTGKFSGSPFFTVTCPGTTQRDAEEAIQAGFADFAIIIPEGFEKRIVSGQATKIQLLADAINGTVAGIGNGYVNNIVSGFNLEIAKAPENSSPILIPAFYYNPGLNYKLFMVPAILVILVTITGMFLAAMNIVREKENGTMEQINVTPVRKHHFIIGKLVPFWIVGIFELGLGLCLGWLLFRIPIEGNLLLLFLVAGIYLLSMQGVGLFFSTFSGTQQQAMFISFFFMIVFTMMSGIFTPAESMPHWAQQFNYLNPVAYFMKMIRMILIKGSGFFDILPSLIPLSILATAMISLSVFRYRKTV